MLKSENHLLFSWHELARKKCYKFLKRERRGESTWGRAWLQQMVWDWRGQSKRMQGCHCERKRKRKRKRSYKKRELVWFVGSVVCKKDSHSLGNILSFAKWIGHRERERERERDSWVSLSYAPCRVWQFTTTGHVAPVMGWPNPMKVLPTAHYCLTLLLYCYYNFLLATTRAFASAAKIYIYFNIRISFLFYFHIQFSKHSTSNYLFYIIFY